MIKFEKKDLWVGIYWNVTTQETVVDSMTMQIQRYLDIYLCLVPCLPIHWRHKLSVDTRSTTIEEENKYESESGVWI